MASDRSAKIDAFINEKYIPLDKKVKIGAAVALLLLPGVLFYFLLFAPKQEEINSLEAKKAELSAEVDKAEKAAANKKQHEDELIKAQEEFAKIAVKLPREQEIPGLLRTISDHGKRAGLDFISFKPGAEVPKDFYAEIPVSIEIKGPYHNIGYFLDQVSKLERIVSVDNIKMGSPKEEEGEMLLSSSCTLLTYRFTDQPLAPPAEQGGGPGKK
jgi:type IV pilus assembly protein PilO